jgi:hypothetical protein
MISSSDVAGWLRNNLSGGIEEEFTSMATFERQISQKCLEVQRAVLEGLVQEVADKQPLNCPQCHRPLLVVDHRRPRTVETSFGKISYTRGYGFCPDCSEHVAPVDLRLGLHERAAASPRLQEIAALSVLRSPANQASEDVLRMTGISMSSSTLHREARRQGERALRLRDRDESLTQTSDGIARLSAQAPKIPDGSTMVIEIDAWNIRERDHWGETEALQKEGKEAGRWHWVYTGTVFRLDQRGQTQSGRAVIAERGYVATRRGTESFRNQLYAEALRRGLDQAETVLVLADGAVWIWNLVQDRFAQAVQRLDLYHAREHLWALAGELFGPGSVEAEAWVRPHLNGLKDRENGAVELINSLEEFKEKIGQFSEKQAVVLGRELNYFKSHEQRMDYKTGSDLGQPVGSGAIESTCAQYQRRFKLTGQFWSLEGDEAFLALWTLNRNGRWGELFT